MSSKFKNEPGYLVVWMQTEGKGDVTEEEFHEWYDNEHIPLRVTTLPTFQTAARYRSLPIPSFPPTPTSSSGLRGVDQPKWVAVYTISNNEVFGREEYTKLRENRSEREGKLVVRLDTLDRRIYSKSTTSTHPDPSPTSPLPTLLLLNAFSPSTSTSPNSTTSSTEFDALLASAEKRYEALEGFERVRRYEIVERAVSGVGVDEEEKKRDRGVVLEVVELSVPSPSTSSHTSLLSSEPLQALLKWYKDALTPLASVIDFRAYEQFKVHRPEAAIRELEGK